MGCRGNGCGILNIESRCSPSGVSAPCALMIVLDKVLVNSELMDFKGFVYLHKYSISFLEDFYNFAHCYEFACIFSFYLV